jgi:hypothetical protein
MTIAFWFETMANGFNDGHFLQRVVQCRLVTPSGMALHWVRFFRRSRQLLIAGEAGSKQLMPTFLV